MASMSGMAQSFRAKLHDATFILPTGQRQRVHARRDEHVDDRTPLLYRSSPLETPASQYARLNEISSTVYSWIKSETGVGVLKCSLAYLLGTLATFVPVLSAMLGQKDGKHTVATITVYFHPARTRGSMLQALICASLAFAYAAFISITSMIVSVFFQDSVHLVTLGYVIVLLVFCGGGLGFVGWVKQRFGDPLVNVACSLASLAIITVLTKEGAVQNGDLSFAKISQVLEMLVMGVVATMAVCFLVYPLSAKDKLRQEVIRGTDSLSDMLEIITESFLYRSSDPLEERRLQDALSRNRKAYTNMEKFLWEAKLEHYVLGTERQYLLEKEVVHSVAILAQSLGGLRIAAALQSDLLRQTYQKANSETPDGSLFAPENRYMFSPFSPSPKNTYVGSPLFRSAASLINAQEAVTGPASSASNTDPMDTYDFTPPQSPADIVEHFIFHLGPSMRSLSYTLKEILEALPYGPEPDFKVVVNSKFRISLDRALDLYRTSREEALKSVYSGRNFVRAKSTEIKADLEEVAASCGHFSFSLQEFAEQLKGFIDTLDRLQLECEERPGGRSWGWLKFWRLNVDDDEIDLSISRQEPVRTQQERISADLMVHRVEPVVQNSTKSTDSLRYRIWKALRVFRMNETKFAVKVGTGAALYALPSFLRTTRPIYSHWRGEWGLLSYMLVCSMTIGASNTTGFARFLGTALGALCAIAAWYVTQANVVGLAIFGWIMSLLTAYLILAKGRGPMGRYIMLTYNLTVLYAYSLSQKDAEDGEDEGGEAPIIAQIALHRVVSVISGIIWGIIITRVVWPISARRTLKDGLSLLWLQMGVVWKRDPLSTLPVGTLSSAYLTPSEQIQLRRFVSQLEALYTSAQSELSLKQPFPTAAYGTILSRTRRMLDAFQAINLEVMKNLTASEGEAAMLRYTVYERRQLSLRISHLLYVLASSMKLGYPLNNSLPSIEHARDRLLTRLYHYRQDRNVSCMTTDEDYALLYAYVLVTGQLGEQINNITQELSKLLGVLNEDILAL